MTDKIIALVDGSIYSKSVCELAAWAALRLKMPVSLLHVLGRREHAGKADLSGAIALGARTALLDNLARLDEERSKLLQQRGRAILDDAAQILSEAGVPEVSARLRMGDLIETVAAQEAEAALIVIGKRGEAADFASLHLGSNLERIVRASHKPVLVAARAFKPIEKVLVAWDGGASARKAVEHIAHNPLFATLEIHLVTVGQRSAELEQDIETARASLAGAGHSVESRIIPGQPDAVLGAMVTEERFDMVVMGAYGHGRIRNLVIGSTTTEMIRSCKAPIYLMR